MIETFSMPFPRQTSKKQRKVYVYLPEGFEPDAAFPVLYMFDGHNVFFDEDATYGKSWGMKEYLENDRTPLVVVAVDCNHSPDHGRLKEYAPFYFQAPGIGQILLYVLQVIISLSVMFINRSIFADGLSSLIRRRPGTDTLACLGSIISFLYSAVISFNASIRRTVPMSLN